MTAVSVRQVDGQTLVPRAQEASRQQEASTRAPQSAQQAALQELGRHSQSAPRRVPASPPPAGRRVRSATEENRQPAGRAKGEQRRPAARPAPARVAPDDQTPPPPRIPGLGERVDVRA
ncbi:MAG TPA: hypothetical protein VIL11_02310 [Limnochordales bacterium]